MPSCAFLQCTNHSRRKNITHGITFHAFPQDELWKHKWLVVVRNQRREHDWIPTEHSRVCSIHFKPGDLYRTNKGLTRITKGAVPYFQAVTPIPANQGCSKATNAPKARTPEIPEPIQNPLPIKVEETPPPQEDDDFEEIPEKSASETMTTCDDEYQIFGDYVANELRNMHFQQYKNDLKRKIQHLIIEYTEMDDNEYFSTKMDEGRNEAEQPSTSAGISIQYDLGIVKNEVIVPDPENE